jgi:hypothetical protein
MSTLRWNTLVVVANILTSTAPAWAGAPSRPEVDNFERQWRVQAWPFLAGCEYSESFNDKIVGLVLHVSAPDEATARSDGRCHVPARHHLTGWPKGLLPGQYVIAGTSERDAKCPYDPYSVKNTCLRVIAVLGTQPNRKDLVGAALEKICSSSPSAKTEDRGCGR